MSINAKDVVVEMEMSGGAETVSLMTILGLLIEEAQKSDTSTFMEKFNILRVKRLSEERS